MRNKKQTAFTQAYNKCHDTFVRYCSALTYGKMDTQDLVQDVLLKTYGNFDNIKDKEKLCHYLIRTAKFTWIDHIRKLESRSKYIERHNLSLIDKGTKPEVLADISLMYEAINKLPAHQGDAIILSKILGFKMKEITEIQQSTKGAVGKKVHLGYNKLKILLLEPEELAKISKNLSLLLPIIAYLESLSSPCCKLASLPKSSGQLANLKKLSLKENQLPDSAIEKIKTALPNCKIEL